MDKLPLPPDFKDFLRLLNSAEVEYLLVGGYAVGIYGYPRATGDMDIWIAANPSNAEKVAGVLRKFGFATAIGQDRDVLRARPDGPHGRSADLHRRYHQRFGN